jgi:hypothetical protein
MGGGCSGEEKRGGTWGRVRGGGKARVGCIGVSLEVVLEVFGRGQD